MTANQKLTSLFVFAFLFGFVNGDNMSGALKVDKKLSRQLLSVVTELGIEGNLWTEEDGWEQISLAVVDLNQKRPRIAGVNSENFIYPASVYKMYVAGEVLRQISDGDLSLETIHVVRRLNDVDKTRELEFDPRPLLSAGDTVTVNYLLDLMITRSDNTAANCLIDIAKRENINTTIQAYGWHGSEVTRKFLRRADEEPGYEDIASTETCALHAATFLYLVYTKQFVNPWVSQQMMVLLGRQLDKSKFALGLPDNAMYYNKTGWYADWTHDVGIVSDGNTTFIVACFLPLSEQKARPIYTALSSRIYSLMTNH